MSDQSKDQRIGEAIFLSYSLVRVLVAVGLILAGRFFVELLPIDPSNQKLLANILSIGIVFALLITDKGLTRFLR
ncbi:MAG: hypothetical protein C5B53_04320 [Candidatus Melainabacteria bacterium]|nr:MAG: hypothetical protein C5B53_04320 [Candidatus Melainabacteria bacterium]